MTRATKSRQDFEREALVAAGLRAPNLRPFTLDEDYAYWLLRRDAPSMLPTFPRMRYPAVIPGPDGLTGPERLAVTGRREPEE